MSDEEKALKLLELMTKGQNYYNANILYSDYKDLLKLIEEDRTETVIDKIKKVYDDEIYIDGAYCGSNGINMLTKIKNIIDNKEEKQVWEDDKNE